jgi:predicted Zn-dependent protease
MYVESEAEDYAWVAAGLGMLGANALLCRYSRDNEREADKFGIRYMVKAGYDPHGMVGVMDKFRKLQKEKPNVIETFFATHPMSQDRYDDAVRRAGELGPTVQNPKTNRERFMDRTSRLRAIKIPIEEMQKAEHLMVQSRFPDADAHLLAALRTVPHDYAALLMMAKSNLAQKKYDQARKYAEDAKAAYPAEPQAQHVAGMAKTGLRQYDAALHEFSSYEQKLPGNPNTLYFKGFCLEKMGRKQEAGREYSKYLEAAPGGEHAEAVKQQLTDWGMLQEEPAAEPAPKPKAQPAPAKKTPVKPTTKK